MSQTACADDLYTKLIAEHRASARQWEKSIFTVQKFRRLLGYVCGLCVVGAYLETEHAFGFLVAATLTFVMIGVLFALESRARVRWLYARDMTSINQSGLSRRQHRWDELPEFALDRRDENAQLDIDLNLFGTASVMQLVCTAESDAGIATIANWLESPAMPEEVQRRQRAVQSLAPQIQWRQELQRLCIPMRTNTQVCGLKDWAALTFDRDPPRIVQMYARVLRFLVPVVVLAFFVAPNVSVVVLAGVFLTNFAMTVFFSGSLHSLFQKILVTPKAPSYRFLSDLFSHIRESSELEDAWGDSVEVADQAVEGLKRLERVLMLHALSRHAMTMVLLYLPLQLFLLWDMQVFLKADQWRKNFGHRVGDWFDTLGEIEALSSFASLSFEQPEWSFPKIDSSLPPTFTAQQLGHPLLPDTSRVLNDVSVGPVGTVLLITGSNMGGKSTLLRAIGLNAVLAQAGAPCCCDHLVMSPLCVLTSVNVADSLSESTSFFMAQLLCIKKIVDHLREQEKNDNRWPVLYLLDEILNGTNTTDRRTAVEGLVSYLLTSHSIGVMTTHDLDIVTESKHTEAFHTFYLCHHHSSEDTNEEMLFDYKLRPGVAPTSNALTLFRILGLPDVPGE